ncbi:MULTISPECIES: SDR family oxidoreductase [Sutcliffiella]|uniref:3-oxoacyl-ACP reductase n=1 Tax=Sutcliffiella cohnii TaxID=33932 RepID=A0A223KQ38_9BACI|nr:MULTISPECIES: SDR family oxidoreductase [Sutcliffiella]AST91487.1 3-oxoacyl-ACP reductase [Sutcliffiella cohnii]WBL17319.1 SDR family oxidoreductase [Sutcliffiella sp. NC1]
MELNLEGKSALVIASSQGLGRAIATSFVKEGVNVVLASRNEEKLIETMDELKVLNKGSVTYIKTDITKTEDIKKAVQYTVEQNGTIDILINNAGGPPAGTFEQMDDEQWQNAFELNLLSYIRLIREALPYLKNQGGKIINIASSSIKEPIQGLILSNTFRTGIVGLSKSLATELAPHNILINTVALGRIATDRVAHLDSVSAERQGISIEEVEKKAKANIPLGRYGHPDEFAKVVTFLASDANSYMTGSSFLVDGGMIKSI